MKNRTLPEFIVMSACNAPAQGALLHRQLARHSEMQRSLKELGFSYINGEGLYKGILEFSVIVVIEDRDDIKALEALAQHFDQECILHIDYMRRGFLLYPNGTASYIGDWREVESVEGLDSYSLFLDKFYVVR